MTPVLGRQGGLALALGVLVGCRSDGPAATPPLAPAAAAAHPSELAVAARPGSGEASLAATGDGRVLLGWLEAVAGGGHALRFSERREGGAWSAPRTVAEGTGWFANWADFPRMAALEDGTLFAHWLEKHPGGGPYHYDVRLVRSTDGGVTWGRPVSPYRDATPSEHGFVSFAPSGDGAVGVLFLDGRSAAREDGAMALRFTTWRRSGAPEADAPVDDRVCDCCQTALARSSRGLLAAYRDRSTAEVRDVAVRRLEDGRWSEPVYPGAEGWTIAACPVNGPAIAAEAGRVALAWFTMAGERAAVRAALSRDGGLTWSPPVVIDDAGPVGRVDVVLRTGGAVVSWLATAGSGAEVRLRALGDDGTVGPATVVARTSGARGAGFPQLERVGRELVVAWRDDAEPAARIRTATVALD